ncbi:hypothetical protein [Aquabacterium sp.]|uniref:hypothetical protein n=1 Tax=Aquabacterium sp. TaxID=1872578 RepID=UPI0019A52759|nr:hypothetical protein [Aquabacterium sp.]MBC7699853.1 hypothetical protein [Aquabacterium sp.]
MQRSVQHLFWLASLASSLCSPVFAGGTMFRCGSSYQDRPCDAGQPAKVINSSGVARDQAPGVSSPTPNSTAATTAAPVATLKVDAECAALGNRAKQVVWAKESGKTAEVQLAAANSDDDRRLIADVFNRRGSSLEVRQGVEADCMSSKGPGALANLCQVLKGQMGLDQTEPKNRQRQAAAKAWRDAGC